MASILVVGAIIVAVLFLSRSRYRKLALGMILMWTVLTLGYGRLVYQVFWLDEELWGAAWKGDEVKVREMLAKGADPNTTWEDGKSALEAAIEGDHLEIVKILREAGAR